MSAARRRRLYREGKRLLGPDRMARLRERGLRLARRSNAVRGRVLRVRDRLGPALRVERTLGVDARGRVVLGRLAGGLPDGSGATLRWADGREGPATLHRYADRRSALTGTPDAFAIACDAPEPDDGHDAGLEDRPGPRELVLTLPDGRRRAARCPAPDDGADDGADGGANGALERVIALLGPLGECTAGRRALLDAVLGPAIERAWAARPSLALPSADPSAAGTGAALVRHNPHLAPERPRTSIIVPIYGRHDFIAHQLVHFAQDAEVRGSELIWVIDDPRLDAAVRRDAERLARLHDVAFTVLHLGRNLGYAGANNAAAAVAAGDELLLLNSDVLPAAPGWLGRMRAAADGAPGEAVAGARLLYDDGTVQHDGMRFERAANFDGLWLNRHPGKGLPADLFDGPDEDDGAGGAGGLVPREAVTGACLLVGRERYLSLGGLDEGYVLGDFEDSDFCLKARAAGLHVGVAPGATLYHLERQSQSLVTGARWKTDLTHYNCWVHTRRWHDAILALQGARA